jgi:hypothetical protein
MAQFFLTRSSARFDTPGERRLAERLAAKMEDDYLVLVQRAGRAGCLAAGLRDPASAAQLSGAGGQRLEAGHDSFDGSRHRLELRWRAAEIGKKTR